jgi:phosphatidylserine decarboxylase
LAETSKYPLLAREGWGHIAYALSAAIFVNWMAGWLWALPLWIIVVFVLQFFRDPPRVIPQEPNAVVCPADGRVIIVDEVEDPYLKRPARRISVFMNVFNVHSNRAPVAGEVKDRWYHPGSFLNAALDKAARENERNALWVKTDDGQDVVFVQVAGLIARRILCYAKPGDRLERGMRYGFIRFGSRVDVYLPLESKPAVSLGDKVKGGSQILASLLPRETT